MLLQLAPNGGLMISVEFFRRVPARLAALLPKDIVSRQTQPVLSIRETRPTRFSV